MNLTLIPSPQAMYASWILEKGNYEIFEVTITTTAYVYMPAEPVKTTNFYQNFDNLKAGVEYTVSVVTCNGNLTSTAVTKKGYTRE